MKNKLNPEMRRSFEEFVAEIKVLLEELQDLLGHSRSYRHVRVAFDDETLDQIEEFYLNVLSGKEKIHVPQERLDRMYVAYIGEARINRVGGKWILGEDDFTFGEPSVASEGLLVVSPMYRINLQKQNRKPFLREWIDYCVNKDQYEEELFKEFE